MSENRRDLQRCYRKSPSFRWACTIDRAKGGVPKILAYDPEELDWERLNVLLDAFEEPHLLQTGGMRGGVMWDGTREVKPGQRGHYGATLESLQHVGFLAMSHSQSGPTKDPVKGSPEMPGAVEPLFEPNERLSFDEAWHRLPIITTIGERKLRWLGPLVDSSHAQWIGDLSNLAWGPIGAESEWSEVLGEAGEAWDVQHCCWRPEFAEALETATSRLVRVGGETQDVWASWIGFQRSELHRRLRRWAERWGAG